MRCMSRKPPRRADRNGAELLRGWRERVGKNQQDAADVIGIDLARYNAFEHDRKRPGLDWAFRIETATDGAVPAESWAREPKALAS